ILMRLAERLDVPVQFGERYNRGAQLRGQHFDDQLGGVEHREISGQRDGGFDFCQAAFIRLAAHGMMRAEKTIHRGWPRSLHRFERGPAVEEITDYERAQL